MIDTDPLPLAQALLRAPSVTPDDAGAQDALATALERLGLRVERLNFGRVANLYARIGDAGPHLCFAGHTDVVPPGDGWRHDPFGGAVIEGVLHGRGAVDMKSAVAAFAAACARHLAAGAPRGSLSLLITGDEEGDAVDGTARVVDLLLARGERPDFCVVGEPTCRTALGDVVKIGRRGSLTARIAVEGTQGHVAYPHRADNPVHRLVRALDALIAAPLDDGTDWFEPSGLQVSTVDVGNPAANVIPGAARATLNIRYNDRHDAASLTARIRAALAAHAPRHTFEITNGARPFLTEPGEHTGRLCAAIEAACGRAPVLDTGGGTSDARFIRALCPVAEFGLVGTTMHQVDERVPVAELRALADAYAAIIAAFLP